MLHVCTWNGSLPRCMSCQIRTPTRSPSGRPPCFPGSGSSVLSSPAITGAAVAIIPLVAFVLFLQRFWKLDLLTGGLKG